MHSTLKVGSRSSALALIQVKEVFAQLPNLSFTSVSFKTAGDKDKTTPLTAGVADNFFTDAIDQALLEGQIDVAVHSAKDLPQQLPDGLEILALTRGLEDADAWVSPYAFNALKPQAHVGTSSQLRQAQVKALRPDVQIVDIRGTIEERLKLVQDKKIDGIIVALCALKRLGLHAHVKEVLPWEGMPLQGQLAIVGKSGNEHLKKLFKPLDVRTTYGTVTLVGAGPGDPDLITVKAVKALSHAQVVFYDYLVNKDLLKFATKAEHIYVGKRKGDHTLSQTELSRMLRLKAMSGANVVRLKGGDPFIFGRGVDEIQYLSSYHIHTIVIPGISSATGIPSSLKIPLTARGISASVAFVSAHEEDEDKLPQAGLIKIPNADTIVFLMGLTKLKAIVESLKSNAWPLDTPMVIVSKGTCLDEEIVSGSLKNIEGRVQQSGIKPPALIIAGKTTAFLTQQPQKTYLHCGTHPEIYRHLGRIIPFPMIKIQRQEFSKEEIKLLINDVTNADLVILTSPAAAEHIAGILCEHAGEQLLSSKIVAAIGRHTADVLATLGVSAQIIAHEETAQGMFKTLSAIMDFKNKTICFPRSALPNPFLRKALENAGAKVTEWPIYTNQKPAKRSLPNAAIGGIIFTSPSTAVNFLEDYQSIPSDWEILAKGPVTQETLSKAGYSSKIIP